MEVPEKVGVSGTAGKRAGRAAGEDEEGAGGTLPVLRVVPAVPRRYHPQVRGCERGGAGGQEGRTQGKRLGGSKGSDSVFKMLNLFMNFHALRMSVFRQLGQGQAELWQPDLLPF